MEREFLVPIDYDEVEAALTERDAEYKRLEQELYDVADDYERILRELPAKDSHAVEEYCSLRWELESRAAELLVNHYAAHGASEFKERYTIE